MAYSNLFVRILSSFILILVYSLILHYKQEYLIFFVTFIYLLILLEVFIYFKKIKLLISSYIITSYLLFLYYFFLILNLSIFTLIIILIITFDSSCYIFGKLFGRRKININISPNKTYEGLFGGIIFANLFSYAIFYFNNSFINFNFNIMLFSNLVITCAFLGDFIQSYFKRINNLKDSSSFIPGHGGFFDRFDSLLFVIIFLPLFAFI
tara:strand:- start:1017 stop:1643 length:627 start_codon:yes stop_codon:yes gene_type:complete